MQPLPEHWKPCRHCVSSLACAWARNQVTEVHYVVPTTPELEYAFPVNEGLTTYQLVSVMST